MYNLECDHQFHESKGEFSFPILPRRPSEGTTVDSSSLGQMIERTPDLPTVSAEKKDDFLVLRNMQVTQSKK